MPTSSKFFYNFLQSELSDENGLTLFALYTDLRRYIAFCTDGAHEIELEKLAKRIYKDYLESGGLFSLPKNDIVMDLLSGQDSKGNICFELNENLFADLF
jgi:hypothetical protein